MKYLKELCNVYWARPENAFGIARCMQLLEKMNIKSPSLDLMCGHGIWSFIKAGGDFDYDFDCYQDVVHLNEYKKGVDIQNYFSKNYKPSIIRKPKYKIDYGLANILDVGFESSRPGAIPLSKLKEINRLSKFLSKYQPIF